ncbi:hypothetical protein [Marinicrinis sediminis]|uniref:Uncharacterized protein n=1 Tax=Marinicrinis sediminis TaxID=1652465 RepID=A0ABW5R6L5_9BACL
MAKTRVYYSYLFNEGYSEEYGFNTSYIRARWLVDHYYNIHSEMEEYGYESFDDALDMSAYLHEDSLVGGTGDQYEVPQQVKVKANIRMRNVKLKKKEKEDSKEKNQNRIIMTLIVMTTRGRLKSKECPLSYNLELISVM